MPGRDRVLSLAVFCAFASATSSSFAQDPTPDGTSQPTVAALASTGDFVPPPGPAVAGASDAARTERPRSLLDEYRARELHTRFSFWTGQTLFRGGRPVDVGYFGGGSDEIFAGSPGALDSMSTFQTLRIGGTTAYVVGLGLLVTDIVLLATQSSAVVGKNSEGGADSVKPLAWGLLVSGGVLGIGGGIAMQSANGYLSDAVEQYNADLASRLKGESAARWRNVGVRFRGAF